MRYLCKDMCQNINNRIEGKTEANAEKDIKVDESGA